MNSLKDIILKILQEIDYEELLSKKVNDDIPIWLLENREWSQYILVTLFSNDQFIEINWHELQSKLFSELNSQECIDETFEKNTTWLLCVEANEKDEKINQKTVFIEDDAYYFKKLVLTYQQETCNKLLDELSQGDTIINCFQMQLDNTNRFKNFMEGIDDVYGLILKLLIKIPYIPLVFPKIENIKTLSERINENLCNEKLEVTQKMLCDKIDNITKQLNSDLEIENIVNLFGELGI